MVLVYMSKGFFDWIPDLAGDDELLVYLALGVLLSSFLRALNGLRLSSKASSSLGLIVLEPCICLRARISWGVCQAATRWARAARHGWPRKAVIAVTRQLA